jgi:hypothetical protein
MLNVRIGVQLFIFGMSIFTMATARSADEYVAHEWGTFTSVQGSDGVLLEWRPLVTSELPEFVYDRSKPDAWQTAMKAGQFTKADYGGTERMETPVIYFYPQEEMVVDVSVKFPQGAITEWYPMARSVGPVKDDAHHPADGFLRWGKVRLFPAKTYPEFEKDLPVAKAGTNYFAARETDSAYVRIGSIRSGVFEHEKFLFYRGVGNFKAPLQVAGGGASGVTIKNLFADTIPIFYVLTVTETGTSFQTGHPLKAGEEATIKIESQNSRKSAEAAADELSKAIEADLVNQGIYPREAAAMVKTWHDSWFKEQGTRVLYLLPESWTNQTLPLSLTPAPTELKRVMVGRAELLTPKIEADVAREITGLSSTDFDAREKATKTLEHLGRFAEPALTRVIETTTDTEVRSRAQKLVTSMHEAK